MKIGETTHSRWFMISEINPRNIKKACSSYKAKRILKNKKAYHAIVYTTHIIMERDETYNLVLRHNGIFLDGYIYLHHLEQKPNCTENRQIRVICDNYDLPNENLISKGFFRYKVHCRSWEKADQIGYYLTYKVNPF
jgi:hypothetical protein